MTTARQERIPPLTLGWRLKMALGGRSRTDIAEHLGVDPGTISRWMGDKGAPPKRAYLVQWAMFTGVPLSWLESGEDAGPEPPGPGRPAVDELARLTLAKQGRTRNTSRRAANNRYLVPACRAA